MNVPSHQAHLVLIGPLMLKGYTVDPDALAPPVVIYLFALEHRFLRSRVCKSSIRCCMGLKKRKAVPAAAI